MSGARPAGASERALTLILRLMGSSSLLALIFVLAPSAWMDSIHADLGLGPLPRDPVVDYLARSTSAFYALVGGLMWVVSFDLRRHRPVLIYLGCAIIALGATLLVVDWRAGLPLLWKVWEGPFVITFGVVVLLLSRAVEPRDGDGR